MGALCFHQSTMETPWIHHRTVEHRANIMDVRGITMKELHVCTALLITV